MVVTLVNYKLDPYAELPFARTDVFCSGLYNCNEWLKRRLIMTWSMKHVCQNFVNVLIWGGYVLIWIECVVFSL